MEEVTFYLRTGEHSSGERGQGGAHESKGTLPKGDLRNLGMRGHIEGSDLVGKVLVSCLEQGK